MKLIRVVSPLALLLAAISCSISAQAQNPTAVQDLQLSAFGGISGDFTGLDGGKNASFTAGVDLALIPIHGLRPTLEVRGTYPFDKGTIVSQKDILGGLRVDFLLNHRIRPYGDFFFGRGEMDYNGIGKDYNGELYELTTTYVYSPGGGIDYQFTDHFSVKLDGQYQRWGGPTPTPSGAVFAKVATAALVYRFDFNRHGIR